MKFYDVIIVGAGPAGLTAGLYSGRYMLKTKIVGELIGGAVNEAHKVCNFPSFIEISGVDLVNRLVEQLNHLGVEIKNQKIKSIMRDNDFFKLETEGGQLFAKKIILATGRKKQKLGVPGEDRFLGRGVSYCATCDSAFFKDKVVSVIGGGNSALTAALLLSEYATKVYIIYRKSDFIKAEPSWIKLVKNNKKIECKFNTEVIGIKGSNHVEKLMFKNNGELNTQGVFIEVGYSADDSLLKQLKISTSDKGYILTDNAQKTNVKGIFAAGDNTNQELKQVITACGQGAIASNSAYKELVRESI